MPTIEMLPLTFALEVVLVPVELEVELLLLLPQPASAISAANAATATTRIGPLRCVVFIRLLLSPGRHRCPGPFPDRRNAGCGCRQRPPLLHPPRPASAARTAPRWSPCVRPPPARSRHSAHLRLRPARALRRSALREHPPRDGP